MSDDRRMFRKPVRGKKQRSAMMRRGMNDRQEFAGSEDVRVTRRSAALIKVERLLENMSTCFQQKADLKELHD
ncbi:hypothetical protein [Bradyrhizobium mercantei]|uniref:hypothetical protein n=1 Tax=Bradyrhizobium mercantei TaxID=1904807 RepID=UPI001178A106|nr:hypothetical protein [Bradyrhizobium mercantei]